MLETKKIMTYKEYLEIDEETYSQLIEGEFIMSPAPTVIHQWTLRLLFKTFDKLLPMDECEIFFSPIDVILSESNVYQPDLIVIKNENKEIIKPKAIYGAPNLVVEILSPATAKLDRGKKMEVYSKSGVKEYWIMDTGNRIIEIYHNENKSMRLIQLADENDITESVEFPEIKIEMKAFWKELDF